MEFHPFKHNEFCKPVPKPQIHSRDFTFFTSQMSDYIPEVIQVEILKLLPVKSLLRFRCVCKWWKQYIDSPTFQQEHLALQKPRFIVECEDKRFVVFDSHTIPLFDSLTGPNNDQSDRFHLIGTLHGIVHLYDDRNNQLLLWNPSIHKSLTLPKPMSYPLYIHRWPSFNTYSSFWIDPSTKDFKVIIFQLSINSEYGVNVVTKCYSSIRKDWKVIPFEHALPVKEGPSVVIGEVAYWRTCVFVRDEQGENCMTLVVLSFDFEHERFDIIDAPSVVDENYPTLGNWRGNLSLIYVLPESRCEIYLRQEGSWVNIFGFNLPSGIDRVLWMVGEIEERRKILATIGRELVFCEPQVGCVHPLENGVRVCELLMADDFVESLLFP